MAVAGLLCLLAAWASGAVQATTVSHSAVGQLSHDRAAVELDARVDGEPRLHPRHGVVPESVDLPATAVVVVGRGRAVRQHVPLQVRGTGSPAHRLRDLPVGATVRFGGRLAAAQPGEGLAGVLTIRTGPRVVKPPGRVDAAVNALRAGLRGAMVHSRPEQAGLLPSMVEGDTSGLDPALGQDFRTTGLTHLTAVSGTNLTLTLAFLMGLARWVGVRGWWVRLTGLVAVALFVVVCRAEPSVVRAGAMGLVALVGVGVAGGTGRGLRHLCVAVWVLVLFDPWLSRSLGFVLSVLATAGILWWGGRWQRAMAWAPGWLAESVAIPLSAQLATQALVTSISGQVSAVGLVANGLAAPFVGPATVLGLVTMLVAVVALPLARLLGWCAGWCVQPIIWVATSTAHLPAASWRWPASPARLALLTAVCLVLAPLVPRVLSRPWWCLLLSLVLAVACVRQPTPVGWPGPWQVTFCDVGQGDATVLRTDADQAVVVDVGPDPTLVVDCLRQLGVRRVPLLVLTHFHDDHIAGLSGVLSAVSVGQALLNPVESPAAGARRVHQLLAAHAVASRQAVVGQRLGVGAASWQTVGVGAVEVVPSADEGESSAENDSSIVGVVQLGSALRVVVGGDVEPAGQQRVVVGGWHPGATILKMPHHGSARQDARFWCDSGAALAVASAGYRNDYGHPAPAALRLASQCGMQVARTDLQGSVSVWLADGRLQVRSQRDGPP